MSVVAFQSNSKSISIFGLADLMAERKWQLNILQFPAAIHICVTLSTIQSVDRLIQDMKESLEILKKDPSKGKSQVTAIYGSAAAIPDRSLLEDVAGGYLDGTIHY